MADLTCQELVELVTDYLDGALDEETADRFERHVARCPGCTTYLEQMRQTATVLGEIPVETLSEEMQSTLLDTFRDFPR
jgi:anti-sigma factor RsiW